MKVVKTPKTSVAKLGDIVEGKSGDHYLICECNYGDNFTLLDLSTTRVISSVYSSIDTMLERFFTTYTVHSGKDAELVIGGQ